MTVYYHPNGLQLVRAHLDWQFGHNRDSVAEAAEEAQKTKWQYAAKKLLEGQRHNRPVQIHYLQYFPYAIRYAGQLCGKPVHIHDPAFGDSGYAPAESEAVKSAVKWQYGANYESLEETKDRASDGNWHDCAYELCNGQRHNPGAMQDYMRYFSVALREAGALLGATLDIHDPDFARVSGLRIE